MILLVLAASSSLNGGSNEEQLSSQLEQIQEHTRAKLAQLSADAGFAPASFAEVGAGGADDALERRLRALESQTAELGHGLAPSSFVETDATDSSFEALDKRLADLHAETQAKIKDLFGQRPKWEKAPASSFAETAPAPAQLQLATLAKFGTPGYAGPSSAHLEQLLQHDNEVAAAQEKRLEEGSAGASARERQQMAAWKAEDATEPSSFVQKRELQWDDNDAYSAFSDKIKDITAKANQQLADIRSDDEQYTAEEQRKLEQAGPSMPSSFLQTKVEQAQAQATRHFADLQAKIARLEEENKQALASIPPLVEGSSFLETGAHHSKADRFAPSFQEIRDDLQAVWAGTNQSIADLRAQASDASGPSGSLLEQGDTPLHDKFASLKAKFKELEDRTREQLVQQVDHNKRARASLQKFEASSFLETAVLGSPPTFASLRVKLHAIEAQTKKALAAFPVSPQVDGHMRKR